MSASAITYCALREHGHRSLNLSKWWTHRTADGTLRLVGCSRSGLTQTLLTERMATRGCDGEVQQAQAQWTLEVLKCHGGVCLGRWQCRR